MTNRLENLPSGQQFDAKISDNKTSPELKNHLENIKKILKDNPSKEEISSAKKFLDSLSSLKTAFETSKTQTGDETKQKLDKLSGEFGIYSETQILIEGLKTNEKGAEVDNDKIEFESLFKGIKNEMLEKPKLAVSGYIEGNEAFKKFDVQTKENLKIGLTAKIINSGFVDSLMGGFSSKIKGYSKVVSGENVMESIGTIIDSDKSELGKIDFEEMLKKQIDNHGNIIKDFVKKNENHPNLSEFLKNSKNIEQINPESNLDSVKFATPKDEKEAFSQLQSKIAEYNKQILVAENAKNQIFDQVSKMPSFISDAIVGFIKFLCGLSFIGDFIKKFLGLKGNGEDEIEKELKGEFEARKSINKLISYGIKQGENGEIIESKNEPAILILKDKDLSGLEVKKIKDSVVGIKDNGVDIMKSDFWFNVFEKNEIQFVRVDTDKKNVIITEKIPAHLVINEKDFDKNKCPNEEFYKKLNQILKINNIPPKTEPTKETKEEQPKAENKLVQYKDLLEGVVINNQIENKLKIIKLSDFENNSIEYVNGKISQILGGDNEKVLLIIAQYHNAIKGLAQDKLKDFKITCLTDKKDPNSKEITFLDISYHRKNLIRELIGIIPESEEKTTKKEGQITYAEHESLKEEAKKEKTKSTSTPSNSTEKKGETIKPPEAIDNGLPKSLTFNKESKTLIIDGKKYGISAIRTYIPISIDDVNYKTETGEIAISGSLGNEQDSKTLDQAEVKKYYAEIKKLNQGGDNLKINKGKIDITITALS